MNRKRKGKVYETGKGIFKYRVSVNKEPVYLPLMATNRKDAEQEAKLYQERIQGSTVAVVDALRALADRLEGKVGESGELLPQQAWMRFIENHQAKGRTIQFYESIWIKFCRWLKDEGLENVGRIADREASAYLKHLEADESLSGQTINKHLSGLRLIWKKGVGSTGPWQGMKSLRRSPQVRHQPFGIEDLRVILNRGDTDMCELLAVMAYTGMSLIDACRMDSSMVYWNRGVIEYARIKTENRGQTAMLSKVGIHPAIAPILKRRASGGPVFPMWYKKHKRDSSRLVRMIQQHLRDCGIGTNVTVRGKKQCVYGSHSFRHTVQTMLSNNDIHPSVMDVILGHKAPGVSSTYTHVSDVRVQDAIAVIPDVVNVAKVIEFQA